MKFSLIGMLVLSTLSGAFANEMPAHEEIIYQLNCDTTEELRITISGQGRKLMTIAYTEPADQRAPDRKKVVSTTVEMKNQTKLIRVSDNEDTIGFGKTKYYEKTTFGPNNIKIENFAKLLFKKQFESRLELNFSQNDLSAGTLELEYYFGPRNVVRTCDFHKI